MTSIEQHILKGVTVKNVVVTLISTASIVASVVTTYTQLKSDIHDVKMLQDAQSRVNEIRLKVLEGQVAILRAEVEQVKNTKP